MPPKRRTGGSVRQSARKQVPLDEAKPKVLEGIAAGMTRDQAMATVGRKLETFRSWMADDPDFKAEVFRLRDVRAGVAETGRLPIPDFPEFCEELGRTLFPHQMRMWDVLNRRTPADMHHSFRLQWGIEWDSDVDPVPGGRIIFNIPPGFAKTMTFSIMYSTWLIHKNPNIRIIIVCRDQSLAKQILGSVKHILTSPLYRDIHAKYAPEGGWKDPDASWTLTEIYVQGKGDGEKDPTMQALGIGGRIYGQRADVIILDDAVTGTNVANHGDQQRWLDQEVESRLDGRGLLAVFGTRLAPVDLYKCLRDVTVLADDDNDDELMSEVPRWTYFSMPAVLEEPDGGWRNWVSLWPERFPPKRLRSIRSNETTWALTYQQQDVSEDATFNAKAVEASINSLRFPGPMTPGGLGHREGGMSGLYVVGGLDPATEGHTAMQVWGLDKVTQKRYVLDGFNNRNTTPKLMKDTVKRLTETYAINEWVIERNAFQRYLTQDLELVSFLRARGCKLTEHYTTKNKYDSDFGIQAMAQLFLTCGEPVPNNSDAKWRKTPDTALIELPSPRQNAWVNEYINQLVTWEPSGLKQGHKTDLVMAGWFCEIAVKRILGHGRTRQTHLDNPYASKASLSRRTTINIAEWRASRAEAS